MRRLIVVLLGLMIAAAGAAYVLYQRVNQPFRGYQGEAQLVDIPPGATPRTIGERLVAAGVVRDARTYRLALWLSGDARRLQAGEYRFDRPMAATEVVQKVARGDVELVTITFREGLTIGEMSKIFESNGFGSAASFVAAARDPSAVQALDPDARDLEGYLFPDTYSVPKRTDAIRLVKAMTDQFLRELTPPLHQAAQARGLTVRQHVTLASLIEKETGRGEERPLIASVYSNRLKIGMALQCDPTVIYALMLAGRYDGNLRRDDLLFDSPYNTYRYAGLPPGPIAAPGRGALEAAGSPAESEYLYFVSRNDGSHEFARTLAEHNRNVQRWQVQYFRDRRAASAAR
ncbi:MAG: endolytic transglycosylase MltG [Luteitalea sp.]|nr:endolytic transglycosylase MltG [Luteitalea sp.]